MSHLADNVTITLSKDDLVWVLDWLRNTEKLDSIDRKLNVIHALLVQGAQKEAQIMATLADLQAEVARDTDVNNSAITLLQGLTAKIQELINAGADPAAFQALVDQLKANQDALAAAVVANTPTP